MTPDQWAALILFASAGVLTTWGITRHLAPVSPPRGGDGGMGQDQSPP